VEIVDFAGDRRRVVVAAAVFGDVDFFRAVDLRREARSPVKRLGRDLQPGGVRRGITRRKRQLLDRATFARPDELAGVDVEAEEIGGQADDDGARWLSLEASIVRDFDDWSLQAGWRQAVSGRETPASGGPVIALWRRF
jgi:hypothetical protein